MVNVSSTGIWFQFNTLRKVFLNWDSLFVQVKQISTEKLLLMMFFNLSEG